MLATWHEVSEASQRCHSHLAKCGENVNIRRLTTVEADLVGAYLHGHRIGVLVALKGGSVELAKEIAMHVAASNPQFLDPSQVSEEAVAKEKEIFLALNEDKIKGKPAEIVEKMVAGRISKFLAEASLVRPPPRQSVRLPARPHVRTSVSVRPHVRPPSRRSARPSASPCTRPPGTRQRQ